MSSGNPVSAPINPGEVYFDALKKHLPAGLLATYLAADGILGLIPVADAKLGTSWAAFALCLIACPFWMLFYEKNKSTMQIVFACVSFVLLVFSAGGPLALTLTDPAQLATVKGISAVIAVIFTGLVAPIVSSMVGRPQLAPQH
jgi:hypothetical protein